ncbi:MAG: hypothetical protein ACRDRK_08775 [Pseudonocardia sp.]
MIGDWVMVGDPGPVEDRETFHRLADRRRIARAFAWLLYAPTRSARALLMWVAVRRLVLDDGPRLVPVVPAPAPVLCPAAWRWRAWVVCVPRNGPNVAGFGVRRLGMT